MNLRTKFTPIAATLLLSLGMTTAAQAEISAKNLSVSGFIDMSYLSIDVDGLGSSHDSGIDQVELNFGYDFGNKLTATVDVEYQNNAEGVDVEQAFISYAISDNLSIKAGRFLSYSGWEAEEPTGLFQYSGTGYAQYFYGYYQQGISALYSGDKFAVAVSVVNDLAGPQSTDSEHPGIETMVAFMPTESLTFKGFYSVDGDTKMLNTWASYSADSLTLAAEYNSSEDTAFAGSEADGYLLMANYAFSSFGLTLRYHDYQVEDAAGVSFEDASGFTISPSFSVNDNLLMVFEYRMDEVNGVDVDYLAVEALITF
ncbi:porin [Paraglaciecola hydrolytica]|uniref:Porin n=1 Tax=Paraglaciecola hydrolytica TaxID=1799789 RepID=A0A136A4Q4_9ALTE|nr:porin [Paraglaciecola hydrolytica]KXI30213.1 porin [Paraglaciecola hydrolytica]